MLLVFERFNNVYKEKTLLPTVKHGLENMKVWAGWPAFLPPDMNSSISFMTHKLHQQIQINKNLPSFRELTVGLKMDYATGK